MFIVAITSSFHLYPSQDKTAAYYTAQPNPNKATIKRNGVEQDSLMVHYGSVAFWEASMAGFETRHGSCTVKVAKLGAVRNDSSNPVNIATTSSINEVNSIKQVLRLFICLNAIVLLLLGGSFIIFMRKRKATDVPMETNKTGLDSEIEDLSKTERPSDLQDNPVSIDETPQQSDVPIKHSKSTSAENKGQDKFAILTNDWEVVGASVQGNGHKTSNIPCQDSCAYEYLGDGWGIAISSDGAGSAEHSDIGSKITIARAMHYLKHLIKEERWIEKKELPTDNTWMRLVVPELRKVRDDIYGFSQKNNIEYKSLSATIIVVVHSPFGLLVAHIGDGRAGCRDMDGNWKAIITPHKGEEANQTVFLTTGFWDTPSFILSGVIVPETRVIRHPVSAFTLMSDGCENTAWLFNQRDENTGHYYDPNKPFPKFFDPLIESLNSESRDNTPAEEIECNWYSFITEGTRGFVSESDDKTMILGFIRE